MAASTAPATMLPSSAKKMKNLELSHSHGWSTITDGTANHSHIGANQVARCVGIRRFNRCPAMISGMRTDESLIQNHVKSGTHPGSPSRFPSAYESHANP